MAECRWFDGVVPMNRPAPDQNDADATIDLARVPPFGLGRLAVTPAALTVAANGWSQRLEPRAMQVLVALAQAAPDVVGRDVLNRRVWGGRIVGGDAINRTVQTLRRLAADAPPPASFAIETIPRVGYRLTLETPATTAPATATVPPRRRRLAWIAALVAVAALVVLWRVLGGTPAPASWRVAATAVLDDLPPGAVDAALSPEGRRLAYRAQDGAGRERIYVRTGGADAPVSPAGMDARRPVWRADGAALAFVGYDPGRPCRLYVFAARHVAAVGACESARDPALVWSADGRALLFGDAPGENAVQRIGAVDVASGARRVLSSPPGDSMGDGRPIARATDLVFQRQFGWADEGWIAQDRAGRERVLWRRRGVAGSVAAALPDGALAVAWTRAGASGLDLVGIDGRVAALPVALGPVTAMAASGARLLIESDRSESALVAGDGSTLASVRGRIAGPAMLPDGTLRFPVVAAGVARIWQRDASGMVRPWGRFSVTRIAGLAPSPDGRFTAAMVTGTAGREIVLLDGQGDVVRRWHPPARSLNPGAWSGDGRRLIVPVLDGAGWRLFGLDSATRAPPADLGQPGFSVVLSDGAAVYAVRAGETTGGRELWRLDGRPRRLPVDLTLFDIVNWRPVAGGIWLPDRHDRDHPRLVLRDAETGQVRRSVAAPGLAGPGSGLAADVRGPVYVRTARDAPEYSLLGLTAGR